MKKILLLFIIDMFVFSETRAQITLEQYIVSAQQNSPLIKENQNLVKQTKLEAERIDAIYKKAQIALSANYTFSPIIANEKGNSELQLNPSDAQKYIGYDIAASNGGVYQGLINYAQPLFSSKKTEAFLLQNDISRLVSENAMRITSHDLEKLVTDQYILCLLDKVQMDYCDSMQILIDRQCDVIQKLAENGLGKNSDIILMKIESQNNGILFSTYETTYFRDLMDLNIMCGIRDTTIISLKEIQLQIKTGAIRSNYLEKFRLDSLNAEAAQKAFETKYQPQVYLFGNAGLNAVYAPTIPNRFGFSAGLSLNWTLTDGNQKKISREKTALQIETVGAYKNRHISENNARQEKLLQEIESFNNRILMAESQFEDYTSLLQAYKSEMIQGQISVLNYLTVLKTSINAKRDYFVFKANRLLLINAYNYWNW